MAPTPRWGGLRVEPFDPDARDADGDGIVQEGTAWERPVGLRLVDELGRAIARGQTANSPIPGLKYVDSQGNTSEYTPTWTKFLGRGGEVLPEKKRKGTGLARLGLPSLKDRGHRSILDMQKPHAMAMPSEDLTSAEAGATGRIASFVDSAKRHPLIRKLFPGVSPESQHTFVGADMELARFESRVRRVTDTYGPIDTHAHAIAAVNRAFPKLRTPFGGSDTDFINSDGTLHPAERGWVIGLLALAEEDPHIANALVNLTHYGYDRDVGDGAKAAATAGVNVWPSPDGNVEFGFALTFNSEYDWERAYSKIGGRFDDDTDLAKIAAQIRGEQPFELDADISPQRRELRRQLGVEFKREIEAGEVTVEEIEARKTFEALLREKNIYHNAQRGEISSLVSSGDIDADTAVTMFYSGIATHEWGHLRDYSARMRDHGVSLTDQQTTEWLDAAIPVTQLSGGLQDRVVMPDPLAQILLDPEFFTSDQIAEMQASITKARNKQKQIIKDAAEKWDQRSQGTALNQIGGGIMGAELDSLDPTMKVFLHSAIGTISEYGKTNDYELTAELMVAMEGNPEGLLSELEQFSEQSSYFNFSKYEIAAALRTLEGWLKNDPSINGAPTPLDTALMPGASGADTPLSTVETIDRLKERLSKSRYLNHKIAEELMRIFTKQQGDINRDPGAFTFDLDTYYGEGYAAAPRYYESMRKMIGGELAYLRQQLAMRERSLQTRISERQLDGPAKPISSLKEANDDLVAIAATEAAIAHLEAQEKRLLADLDEYMGNGPSIESKTFNAAQYTGTEGAARLIAEHPEYARLVKEERAAKIEANSYFRDGLEDEALVVIAKAQGFDAKPLQVTREEADDAISRGGIRIYRGMPDPEHTTMLRFGDYYGGRGVHGSGYYFGTSPGKSIHYLGEYQERSQHPLNDILTEMILHPDARVINASELRAEIEADESLALEDLGHIAALRGYDAMFVDESLTQGSPIRGPEYVVFNRGALLLPPQPTEEALLAMASDMTYGRPKMTAAQDFIRQLARDPDFLSKTPEERVDYLRSILSDHKDRGLFIGYLEDALYAAEEQYKQSAGIGTRFRNAIRRKKP